MYTYKVQPRGRKNTLLAWVFVLQCAFDVAWIECSSTDYSCQPTIVTSPSFHPRTTFDPYFAVTHRFSDILHSNVTHSISFAFANQTGTKLFRGSSHGTHDFLMENSRYILTYETCEIEYTGAHRRLIQTILVVWFSIICISAKHIQFVENELGQFGFRVAHIPLGILTSEIYIIIWKMYLLATVLVA